MNSKWQIYRVGLIDFWYYDEEEFYFLDGRMLLRGANGSGKSVTMQSFIPLLLDGNMRPERLDPFGSKARKMENYLLEEGDGRDERTGYLYMELKRKESDEFLTLGIGMRARKNKKMDSWYFCITDGRRIGKDLYLYKEEKSKITCTMRELKNRIGEGGKVMETQSEYAQCVNRLLFGFETQEEYRELLNLLIQLRTPKLSKDFKPTVINDILSSSLQTLSEDDLRPMSEAIENMDGMKTNLDTLKESISAAKQIEKVYDQYNEIVLYDKALLYTKAIKECRQAEEKTVQTEKAILENTASYQAEKEHYEELAGEEKLLQEEKDSLADNDAAKLKDREIKISQEIRELQKIVADKKQQEQTKNEKRIDTEEILKKQELKDFYEMYPDKFNNKTNGITQRRFLLHGNPLLASWVTEHIGAGWITDLSQLSKLKVYADDKKAQQEFMNIKYQNKVRLAKYILEHNGIEVNPNSIFDVQVKRLHEYKRQLMNILHVMYLYNKIKEHPEMPFYPRTFIFGAKAAAGYRRAKQTIKLINAVADVINNDKSINGKIKVVFIENYRVSNAEMIFAAADVSEQISTASKEASGTGNMKFMLNGAPTIGTMDGANVEIVEEVGAENAFIFGLSSDEVINYENNGGYDPMQYFNNDPDIRNVLMQLINGTYSNGDFNMFREIYDSLLNTNSSDRADTYFILADFKSYAAAQEKVEEAYRDEARWAKMALLNTACAGKFTSDRTIQQYVDEIWHLDKVVIGK